MNSIGIFFSLLLILAGCSSLNTELAISQKNEPRAKVNLPSEKIPEKKPDSSLKAEDSYIRIVTPVNMSVKKEDRVPITVQVKGKPLDTIRILVDKKEQFAVQTEPSKAFYCRTLKLQNGLNIVEVEGYYENQVAGKAGLNIYVVSRLDKQYKYPSRKYQKTFFHTARNEAVCKKCHDMRSNEVKNRPFKDPTTSNCYTCHAGIAEHKHLHGPAKEWLCGACHTGKTGYLNRQDEGKSKYTFPDPIGDTCLDCHTKERKVWSRKKILHEPFAVGQCYKCHNPHASDYQDLLRGKVNDVCTSCHASKKIEGHIVGTFKTRRSHPVSGHKDPRNPGRELRCASCHNPHASNTPFLTQNDYTKDKILCTMCHKK